MIGWLKQLVADANGMADDARISALLLVLTFIGNSIFSTIKSGTFDPSAYGMGAAAMAGGIGAWFGLRKGN